MKRSIQKKEKANPKIYSIHSQKGRLNEKTYPREVDKGDRRNLSPNIRFRSHW